MRRLLRSRGMRRVKLTFTQWLVALVALGLMLPACRTPKNTACDTCCDDTCDVPATPLKYPAAWWMPVPKEGAPAWEILPQEAGPGEVILSKRNELGLLSNFAATPFTFHGKRYASLEGFWQMMKYPEAADDPRAKFPGVDWKFTRDRSRNSPRSTPSTQVTKPTRT